jgi:hypothetical protein
VFENRVLRRIFRYKKEKVTEDWRKIVAGVCIEGQAALE